MLLEIEGVQKSFGGLVALRSVNIGITAGRIYGVIGPNGAGKTTLFNVITGFSPATGGSVRYQGEDVTKRPPHEIARLGIARTYQLVRPFYELSAVENVKVGMLFGRSRSIGGAALDAEASLFLERVGLVDKANYAVSELSLGERKRLEIAKALAALPRLILFDEVLAGLNPSETVDAVGLFQQICAGGTTVLMIEHNMQAIMSACQHIFVLHHGELISQGSPQQVSADPVVVDAYLGKRDLRLERRRRREKADA